ncbi:MAG: carbohydrate kinase [Chitinophagia bacterium]|nr:carbohydrate kinase [Chitinophagia bacterium]
MRKEPAILVFDIGKTNRKCLVFDRSYNVLSSETFDISDAADEEGQPVLDLDSLTAAMRGILLRHLADPAIDIRAFNITTYGATIVNTDAKGRPVHLPWDYLRQCDESVLSTFDERYGDNGEVYAKTASPRLGNLNTGMQLYLLKRRQPAVFDRIRHSTSLPQWLSGCFTGQLFTESTSIGCHTLCWDFRSRGFPEWTRTEGISRLFPPLRRADEPLTAEIGGRRLVAGIGLHDSSSALIPYLLSIPEPFMLLSTGSWSICLNPFNDEPLNRDELDQDCLCYLTYDGRPVKASRLNAGFRHEAAVKELSARHGLAEAFFQQIGWDPELVANIRSGHPAEGMSSPEAEYYAFMDALLQEQARKIRLVASEAPRHLYVDGGFSRNSVFMGMLRQEFPEWIVRAAEVGQSTALGAAIILHGHWNEGPLPEEIIRLSYS